MFSRVATDIYSQFLHPLVLNRSDAHFQLCDCPHELQICHFTAGHSSLILIYRLQRFDQSAHQRVSRERAELQGMIAINGFVLRRSAGFVCDNAMDCRTTREKDVLSQEDFVLLHRDVHLCLDVTLILAQKSL